MALRVGFSRGRVWSGRLALVVGTALCAYILFLANIIIFRHPVRWDLTQERLHTLTPRTLETLKSVQAEIQVLVPTFLQRDNPRHLAQREVLERARSLLNEYVALQPLIKVIDVDAIARPETWQTLRAQYDLEASQLNRFLFFSGEGGDQIRQSVTPEDMAIFGPVEDPRLDVPEVVDYRGERVITDSLLRLMERRRRHVYFTQDKQEISLFPARPSAQASGPSALNALRRELTTAGYEAHSLALSLASDVPADCELLVIAQPFQSYRYEELLTIDRYLQRGGRLFVALGANTTGLETLLEEWGVGVKDGVIQARRVGAHGWGETKQLLIRRFQANHPATRVFLGSRFLLRMLGGRALTPKGNERQLRSTPLLETFSEGGESHLLVSATGNSEVLEERDFPVAMAVEQEAPTANAPVNFKRLDTRIVVVSASDFLIDKNFNHASHRDFVLNCFAWLVGEEERATTSGDEWKRRSLDMDAEFRRYVKYVPTLVLPGIFLCLGAFVYYLRRV